MTKENKNEKYLARKALIEKVLQQQKEIEKTMTTGQIGFFYDPLSVSVIKIGGNMPSEEFVKKVRHEELFFIMRVIECASGLLHTKITENNSPIEEEEKFIKATYSLANIYIGTKLKNLAASLRCKEEKEEKEGE